MRCRYAGEKEDNRMATIVIGLGSMGKRRIRILKKLFPGMKIVGIDSNEKRAKAVGEEYGITTYKTLQVALDEGDAKIAFVSTGPSSHAAIIKQCLQAELHVFTEINLLKKGYETNMHLAKEKKKELFLSSTFLYRKEIQYIKDKVKGNNCSLNYSYHVGQYLPDWHPWEKIHEYFVGHKETNGCREIFAIELPWLVKVFGEIEDVTVLAGSNTTLDIDYRDNYLVLLKHETGHKGMLAVDVMSRKPVRNLEVFGEDLYMSWNGTPDSLTEYDYANKCDKAIKVYDTVENLEGYSANIIENAYEEEVKRFFDAVEKKNKPDYTFEEDFRVLEWIDRIEKRVI